MLKINSNSTAWFLIGLIILASGIFAGARLYQNHKALIKPAIKAQDIYLAFNEEVYNTIKQNYWQTASDTDLTELYRLAISQTLKKNSGLTSHSKEGLDKLISYKIQKFTAKEKETFITTLADTVLANLLPLNRSRLYSQQLTQALTNEVNNIDTSANLYADLGVDKNAPQEKIAQNYQEKTQELEKQKTPEAKQRLAQVTRAYEALKTPETRTTYDQTGIEPDVTTKVFAGGVYYIKITRFSPTLLQELQTAASTTPKQSEYLIVDLRGNIGGAIDQLPYVLGNFLGQSPTAYSFYHQGNFIPYQSFGDALPILKNFKKVLVLIDNQTQSSAEVMAGAFKKAKFAIAVGTQSKGWGSVERIFDLQNQINPNQRYSIFLVHTLTLSDKNKPIEGTGIQPDVNIKDSNWKQQLQEITGSKPLVSATQNILQ
jgi:curved DNA-binding protein CbpA